MADGSSGQGSTQGKNLGRDDPLLIEYQQAQSSAQHHHTLAWTVTTITWAASNILLGVALSHLGETPLQRVLTTFIGVLGVMLIGVEWLFTLGLESTKLQKYERCKEIEAVFDFQQHRKLVPPSSRHVLLFDVISFFFIIIWLLVIYTVWCDPWR